MEDKLRTFYELTERRRSFREFSTRPVEPEKLERLLEVLRLAQSADNRQPWHFIVVDGKELKKLYPLYNKTGFRSAPLLIAALAEPALAWTRRHDGKNYAWVDVSIAVTEMITAATAEGLASCWIASLEPERIKEILSVPEDKEVEVVALVALGYPPEGEELTRLAKDRKPSSEVIHRGRW